MKKPFLIFFILLLTAGLAQSQTFKPGGTPPSKVETDKEIPLNNKVGKPDLSGTIERLKTEATGQDNANQLKAPETQCARYKSVVCVREDNDIID